MEIHPRARPPLGRILRKTEQISENGFEENSKLNYEEVETILIEIEGVLNSRPLCYVDDSDIVEPITPCHLMYGRNIGKRNILRLTEHDHRKFESIRKNKTR